MIKHPDDALLLRWYDGAADDEATDLVEHVATCAECQDRLQGLADETRVFQAALQLTPAEITFLRAADLPGQLAAAVHEEQARIRQSLAHLAVLFGLAFVVAIAWSLLAPVTQPLLNAAGQLVNVTSLVLSASIQAAAAVLAAVFHEAVLTSIALADLSLPLIALALLLVLWLYRLSPVPARSTTT